MDAMSTSQMNFRISTELRQKFVKAARHNDTDASKLLIEWITDYVEKDKSAITDVIENQRRIDKLFKYVEKIDQSLTRIDQRLSKVEAGVVDQQVTSPTGKAEEEGISDYKLAEILGVAPGTVNRWRTGKRKPSSKYKKLLNNWETKNNRWYKKSNSTT